MDIQDLFERLRQHDRAALARAITLTESRRPADKGMAAELMRLCLPHTGHALRIGITGIPGVGKSTLIDALGLEMIGSGHRVAVLAVDPSSQRSGGSILGDKTRMERLAERPEAFIRPTPTSGDLGGLAATTRSTMLICEAAGYDRLLIETVGVGQSELEVDMLTDINVLLMIAGAGDGLQGIKRGIMESADLVVFTKADGEAEARAGTAAREMKNALALLPPRDSGRKAEILLTSATTEKGIAELAERLEELGVEAKSNGHLWKRRQEQAIHWLEKAITNTLAQDFRADAAVQQERQRLEEEVRAGTKTPAQAAEELLRIYKR